MPGTPTPLCTALLIDGELVEGCGPAEPILNPATGETLVRIAEAGVEQVEAAIVAAQRAFAGWARTTRNNAQACCWRSPTPCSASRNNWPASKP